MLGIEAPEEVNGPANGGPQVTSLVEVASLLFGDTSVASRYFAYRILESEDAGRLFFKPTSRKRLGHRRRYMVYSAETAADVRAQREREVREEGERRAVIDRLKEAVAAAKAGGDGRGGGA